jgi:hypothetical protein
MGAKTAAVSRAVGAPECSPAHAISVTVAIDTTMIRSPRLTHDNSALSVIEQQQLRCYSS